MKKLKIRTECMGCIYRSGDTPETVSCARGHDATCYRKKKRCMDLEQEGTLGTAPEAPKEEKKAVAYTDGSFNKAAGIWGYGVCLEAGGETYNLTGSGRDVYGGWQIQGETTGALAACEKAMELGCTSLEIRYDYEGVACWAIGTWRAKKPYTMEYARKMRGYMTLMDIVFTHVKAHTGVAGNETADALAKKACGVYSPPAAGGYKPEIPGDVNPKCKAAIEAFYKKDAPKFGDFMKLKTFGLDPYSRKKQDELEIYAERNGITDLLSGMIKPKQFEPCVRWIMRGLRPEDAIRKVQVDAEVSANCYQK
ncbi:MAG: hypothetical protein LUE14_12355 [Clostridiales bacterium]|nr:hypothetical protein [Clostridiales bacterium]